MLDKLDAYYRANGIHAEDFHCKFRASCAAGCNNFTEARASLVGEKYDGLVILSLDPGKGWSIVDRTLAGVRRKVAEPKPRRLHWRETRELVKALLGVDDPEGRFAHVNAAKCTQNKPKNAEADPHLFENCRGYLRGELEILNPRIIVTQGAKAHAAFDPIAKATRVDRYRGITDQRAMWIRAYHPSAMGWYWNQKRDHWPTWIEWVNS